MLVYWKDKIPIKLPYIIKSHDTTIFDGYISIFDGQIPLFLLNHIFFTVKS